MSKMSLSESDEREEKRCNARRVLTAAACGYFLVTRGWRSWVRGVAGGEGEGRGSGDGEGGVNWGGGGEGEWW